MLLVAFSPPPPHPPSTSSLTKEPVVSTSILSRTRSGSHGTTSSTPPHPACRRRDLLLLPLLRLRPPSRRLSVPVIEKQTASAFITVVGYDRDDTQYAPSPMRKIPRVRRRGKERTAKGSTGGGGERRCREMRLAFRSLVPPGVYRGKRERTCAPT